ncbi:hypothetical protein KHA80_20110 [Anaerobacillus sp. HL2]|nr:hypothetical protein KHA80_20110 [Anaerobacillus sp. HL2]
MQFNIQFRLVESVNKVRNGEDPELTTRGTEAYQRLLHDLLSQAKI